MSGSKAKEIRKAINLNLKECHPIQKRVYKRLKKEYTKMTEENKPLFLEQLKNKFNHEKR
jgi:hypothetical protein